MTKFLKKDESNQMGYVVKFANSKGAQIARAWYKDEKSAKEALASIKKNGYGNPYTISLIPIPYGCPTHPSQLNLLFLLVCWSRRSGLE